MEGTNETKPIDLIFQLHGGRGRRMKEGKEEGLKEGGREGEKRREGACVNSTKSAWREL